MPLSRGQFYNLSPAALHGGKKGQPHYFWNPGYRFMAYTLLVLRGYLEPCNHLCTVGEPPSQRKALCCSSASAFFVSRSHYLDLLSSSWCWQTYSGTRLPNSQPGSVSKSKRGTSVFEEQHLLGEEAGSLPSEAEEGAPLLSRTAPAFRIHQLLPFSASGNNSLGLVLFSF